MIVSLRSPTRPDSSSPNAGAYGELGSTQRTVVGAGDEEVLGRRVGGREGRRRVVGGAVSPGAVVAPTRRWRPDAAAARGRRAECGRRPLGRVGDLDHVAVAQHDVPGGERAGRDEADHGGDDGGADGEPLGPRPAVPGPGGGDHAPGNLPVTCGSLHLNRSPWRPIQMQKAGVSAELDGDRQLVGRLDDELGDGEGVGEVGAGVLERGPGGVGTCRRPAGRRAPAG